MTTSTTTQSLQRKDIPEEQKWDLTDLFPSDEAWEKELEFIRKEVQVVTHYRGKLKDSASTLLEAIQTMESYQQKLVRVATYANLRSSADGSDPINQRASAKVSSSLAELGAKLSFFQSELLSIPDKTIEKFLMEEPKLETYAKMFHDLSEEKSHTLLPEVEETLAALGELQNSPYMIFQRAKASDIKFDSIFDENGKELPMSAPLYEDKYELSSNPDIRGKAYQSFSQTLNQYKHTFAATYATEVSKQVTLSKLRNYESVTDMLLSSQQVTKEMYQNQLDVIQKELAPHMRKFARLKKEQLGLEEMRYCDLKAPLDPGFNPSTSFEEAKSTILEALKVMGPEYSKIMEDGLNNRWVDLANNTGKINGAFCSSPYGVHPYILITWTDTMRGAFVLAHELGHAGHFYLAGKNQTLFNTRPSTYFIEAPSTLNELVLANHLLDKHKDKRMRQWVITQLLGTYYHNFVTHLLEGEFQRRVYNLAENGVPLTADVLCAQKQETLKNFWGDDVAIDESAGLTWMRQPHYYMGLYPYTYSAGLTISTAVSRKIKEEGKTAVDQWLNVLKLGGTLKPLDLIKKADVDMSKADAIKVAVHYIGSLVDELERSYE